MTDVETRPRATRPHVRLELTRTLDVHEWERQWTAGQVADRYPYGFDRLREHGFDVSARSATSHALLDRVIAGPIRRLSGGLELAEGLLSRGRRRADAVLAFEERTGIPSALRSLAPGEPPTITGVVWATDEVSRGGIPGRIARRGLGAAAAVWALSPPQLEVLRDRFGVAPDRLHFLPFGVDADFWTPGDAAVAPGLVVSAGNDRDRDHSLLVASLRRAQALQPQCRLHLVTRLDVAVTPDVGRVTPSLGHEAIRDCYREAAVVAVAVRPNLHVSGISVVLEAMATARPVVVTATPGMEEYVEQGVTGILVRPGDIDGMASSIAALVQDRERARALGEAGRRAVEERFSTARMASHLAGIVRSAIG